MKSFKAITVCFLLNIAFLTSAISQTLPQTIKSQLNEVNLSPDTLSVYAREINSDKAILNWNGDRSGNPASSIKALTTLVGFDVLGPQYRWPTDIYFDGTLDKDQLNGDIIFKGHGDPFFVNESLASIIKDLRSIPIKKINGNFIVNNDAFKLPNDYPTSIDGDEFEPYNATPDALNFNFRTTEITVTTSGKVPKLTFNPPLDNVKVINRLKFSNGRCEYFEPHIKSNQVEASPEFIFSGSIAKRCKNKEYTRVLVHPSRILHSQFKQMWLASGGELSANFDLKRMAVPERAIKVLTAYSKPLIEQITDMNKLSNNVMTRQLFLTLSKKGQQPGELAPSRQFINNWLEQRHIDTSAMFIDNGSGLSRDTRISPKVMVDILSIASEHKDFNLYLNTLPKAGIDGTMRKRFRDHPAKGQLFIKTGTLRDLRTMAGFVFSKSGKIYAVSSIHPAHRVEFQKGTQVQDKILDWLYQQ